MLLSKYARRVSSNLRDISAVDVISWYSSEMTKKSRRNHIATKLHRTVEMMTTKKIKTIVLITNVKMRLCPTFRTLKSRRNSMSRDELVAVRFHDRHSNEWKKNSDILQDTHSFYFLLLFAVYESWNERGQAQRSRSLDYRARSYDEGRR